MSSENTPDEKSEVEKSVAKKTDPENDHPTDNRNDLIIDEGFPALNTFHIDKKDDKDLIPEFSFASFSSALTINKEQEENILHDCNLAFTAREKGDSDAYSSGATFFAPASMEPRCALEDLALKIFKIHTKNLVPGKHYDVERSGAEWWTLVLDTASSSNDGICQDNSDVDEEEDDEEEDDEVGMHFDADYGLEEQLPNYMLHPRVATVTYLSSHGVPTFIMNKKSPVPSDVEKKSLNGSIDKGWLACPSMGKHIAFDGRLLHGAIGTFLSKSASTINNMDGEERGAKRRKVGEDGEAKECDNISKRVTFMVNVWINHCPIDAELFDDEICSQMKTYWENEKVEANGTKLKGDPSYKKPLELTLDGVDKRNNVYVKKVSLAKGESESVTETIQSVICNREVTINFRSSEETLQEIADTAQNSEGKSIEVQFSEKALELEVGDLVPDSDSESCN